MGFQLKAHENTADLTTDAFLAFTVLLCPAEHQITLLNVTLKLKRLNQPQGSDLSIRSQARSTQTMPIKMPARASLK